MLFHGHPAYEFSSLLSTSLIHGGGLIGIVHLTLELREEITYAWCNVSRPRYPSRTCALGIAECEAYPSSLRRSRQR